MLIRPGTLDDLESLIELMRGYYRDDHLPFDPIAASRVMERLLREPQWGRVWLAEVDRQPIGYLALCIGFSLEFGGNDAFIDEVFIVPQQRGHGYGRQLLEVAGQSARELGLSALHLEVDRSNQRAQQLYQSLGYERRERYFVMSKKIANRT